MLKNYYGASIHGTIGRLVENPLDISVSFQDARHIFSKATPEKPLFFFPEEDIEKPIKIYSIFQYLKMISCRLMKNLTRNG